MKKVLLTATILLAAALSHSDGSMAYDPYDPGASGYAIQDNDSMMLAYDPYDPGK